MVPESNLYLEVNKYYFNITFLVICKSNSSHHPPPPKKGTESTQSNNKNPTLKKHLVCISDYVKTCFKTRVYVNNWF